MTAIEPVPVIPKRKSPTKAQRVRIFDAAGGVCHLCGQPIKHGEKWEAEHVKARGRGGADSLTNYKPAHIDCHKPKTVEDVRVIAKTNRTRAKHLGIKRVGPQPEIKSPPMATTPKAAARAARGHKPSLPPLQLFRDAR